MKRITLTLMSIAIVGFSFAQQKRKSYSSRYLESPKKQSIVYCESKGGNVSDEYIQKVQIGTIDNSSDGGSGYTDFTTLSTKALKKSKVTFTITPKWPGTVYNEGYAIFIDYNQDGDFQDENETVFTKQPTKDTSITGSFTIPTTAKTGKTRMRISLKYNGVPNSCEKFSYGEVEDYAINIESDVTDNVPPKAPTNLTVSNIETRSVTLSWTPSTDDVGVEYYFIQLDEESDLTTKKTTENITYLTPNTAYTASVLAVDKAGNESAKTFVNFTTKALPFGVYCKSKGTMPTTYIEKVELGTIKNTSEKSGYTDFTSISTKLSKKEPQTITITSKRVNSLLEDAYAVFIDYNQDGDFQDEGETVFTKEATKDAVIKGTFTIPPTAKIGETRMRISMRFRRVPTPCEFFRFGEVEDYKVFIKDTEPPTAPTNLTVSNLKERSATINWEASTDNVGVEYYSILVGKADFTSTKPTIELNSLTPNTEYKVSINAVDKAGNISSEASINFKTKEVIPDAYCKSKGNSIADEYIQKVEIGAINNSSNTSSGYTDFTSISTSLTRKEVTTITITPKWTGTVYNEGYTVYIDYNQDKDFDDEGEKVFSKEPSKDASIKGSFTIPESAKTGKTRMRVSLKYNGVAKGCEIFGYGEVEDYSVIIEEKTNVSTRNLDMISVYPNPTSNIFNISSNLDILNKTYRIISISGQSVKTGIVGQNSIDISNLPLGVYTVEVFDGQKVLITKIIKSN